MLPNWEQRSIILQHLYNPAFCGALVYKCVEEYKQKANKSLPLELVFFILPLIFDDDYSAKLSNLSDEDIIANEGWLEKIPIYNKLVFIHQIQNLKPITQEALLFGYKYSFFEIVNGCITTKLNDFDRNRINIYIKSLKITGFESSAKDIGDYFKRTQKISQWLSKYENPETIYIIFGLKP